MNQNYKMILQYDGTRYDGWQKQGNTDQTIQGKLEMVLEKLVGKPVEVHGSGRTDAGVHALGQAANFFLQETDSADGDPESIKAYLNQYLPEDIMVVEVSKVEERFHSRLHAVRKTYLYQIETSVRKNVFERKYVYGLGKKLNINRMRQAAELLIGQHDFKGFCSNKRMKKSTVRTLENIIIEEMGSKVLIRYVGNGFLYNMVRILTGTLIEVGLGMRSVESVGEILELKDRQAAGYTAPAEGLFLEQVDYI